MKKLLGSLLLLVLLGTIIVTPTSYMLAASPSTITPIVYVNNQKLDCDAVISNDSAMISFRDIFSHFDVNINWDQATKTVTATTKDGSTTIILTDASQTVYINGKPLKVIQAPVVDGDTLYVNLRVISEALGAKVQFIKAAPNYGQYDTPSSSIYITTKQ
ncbi:copper amine oxidase N-terminal domain-containing protein [Paenibacillus campi]|uniref:copper amine oxidase N-terminal domain-containing protein n=1 Tax=Paenibacillus campi TaxID=3106031 RepID=UPI002AFE6569|nr:copper amine oxidase N-terminal domain-containing protein [Paenibacillus sp. SGZ-1014]